MDQAVEKVQYITYENLSNPSFQSISQQSIEIGFESKQWFIQFQTLTNLRQANRYYSSIFINQLLTPNTKYIVAQVDNLRSNNAKEALTLLTEVIQFQDITNLPAPTIRPIVSSLFTKSNSEKGFLKTQALKAISFLSNKWNQYAIEELCQQTQNQNGQISQLAIKILSETLENNKICDVDGKFLKILSNNLNGKRAVIQKKAKQILNGLKIRKGEEQLEKTISSSSELLEEESNTLRREMKREEQKAVKAPSLKEFLKAKKQEGL